MDILEFYRYLYYRIYAWQLKKYGAADLPQLKALSGVSILMCANLLIIPSTLLLFGIDFFKTNEPSRAKNIFDYLLGNATSGEYQKMALLVLLFIIIGVINYFLFIHKGIYLAIGDKYKHESTGIKNKKTFLLWLYVIMSILAPVILAFIAGIIRKSK